MSRTYKERHKWKAKERRRTGQADPPKIKRHRERFVKRKRQRETPR